jgi:hypothetical protein
VSNACHRRHHQHGTNLCIYPAIFLTNQGGLMDYAFDFVEEHGIEAEADYPVSRRRDPRLRY